MVGRKVKNVFGKMGVVYRQIDDMVCVLWNSGRYGWVSTSAIQLID